MGSQTLSPKEANLFKLVVKAYESKQYKKGLKSADQILKKHPDHGETLSMKGLLLNCLERKVEAYELVRKGIKHDLKSHVSWHVYGLLYRSDREYREAIKCYRNALRIEPENLQILRDLSLLQAQMRDRPGFVETRQKLLSLKPNHKNNWISFALAHHINHNPGMAVQILEAYEGTMEDDAMGSEQYEHSEMLLYKAMVLEESGKLKEALNHLDESAERIVDKLSLREKRASLLVSLKRPAEAEKEYRGLLARNPDNHSYYHGLQACLGLLPVDSSGRYSERNTELLHKLYLELQKKFPKSSAAKRIPLDFLQGDAFKEAVEDYIRPFLRKGVPSLFSDLKSLYKDTDKVDTMESIFKTLEASLKENNSFPENSHEPHPAQESPSTLLWLLFLLAQHYDKRQYFDEALEKIDEAIQHTPTVMDLHVVKARIMKHCGDFPAAAQLADEARRMDLADRFLNSEAVKRMLQADQVENAEKTAALFTKDGEQHETLMDMQCMWYELASGDSHFRQGVYGKALKKYLAVNKHYNDMTEDQFDFHTYCLRKMTLRAYIQMLRFEDTLHSHHFFCKGARGAIRCYLALHKNPPKTPGEIEESELAAMSAADRKKLRQKQRKAEARAKKEAEEKTKAEQDKASSSESSITAETGAKASGQKKAANAKPVDDDPDGVKLAQVEKPLEEATKFVSLLQEHAAQDLQTHVLAFHVFLLRGKLLLALQALKRQLRLDSSHQDVHRSLVQFFHTLDALPPPATEQERVVRSVLHAERDDVSVFGEAGGQSLEHINSVFCSKHADSLPHRSAAAEMLALISPNEKEKAVSIIESYKDFSSRNWALNECVEAHAILKGALRDDAAAKRWTTICASKFPRSVYFQGKNSSIVAGVSHTTSMMASGTISSLEVDSRHDGQVHPTNGISKGLH